MSTVLTDNHARIRLLLSQVFADDGEDIYNMIKDFVDIFEPQIREVSEQAIERYNLQFPRAMSLCLNYRVGQATPEFIDQYAADKEPESCKSLAIAIIDSIPEQIQNVFHGIRNGLIQSAILPEDYKEEMKRHYYHSCENLTVGYVLTEMPYNLMNIMALYVYAIMTKERERLQLARTLLDMCRHGHYPICIERRRVIFIGK